MLKDKIGLLLRKYRKEANLNQKEFADMVGMSRANIVNIEKGNQSFLLKNVELFANKLEIKPEALLVDFEDIQKYADDELKKDFLVLQSKYNEKCAELDYVKSISKSLFDFIDSTDKT